MGRQVFAWGRNFSGELGTGAFERLVLPELVSELSHSWEFTLGRWASFARQEDDSVLGWGSNDHGQLGNGTGAKELRPVEIPRLEGSTRIVTRAWTATFALRSDGSLWVAGEPAGLGGQYLHFERVTAISGVIDVDARDGVVVAVKADGTVWGWGSPDWGRLGPHRDTGVLAVPTPIPVPEEVTSVRLGTSHCAALTRSGTVLSWGSMRGTLREFEGDSAYLEKHDLTYYGPVYISGAESVRQLTEYPFALSSAGEVYSWASSNWGGPNPTNASPMVATKLPGVTDISHLVELEGLPRFCGLTSEGHAWTWEHDPGEGPDPLDPRLIDDGRRFNSIALMRAGNWGESPGGVYLVGEDGRIEIRREGRLDVDSVGLPLADTFVRELTNVTQVVSSGYSAFAIVDEPRMAGS